MVQPSATVVPPEVLSSATPTRSLPTLVGYPSQGHYNNLQPRITPTPTSTCPPNALVVQLSTTLLIPDYSRFFAPTNIETFSPSYTALADGSLLTPPFNRDITDSNLSLLVTGALAIIFARNIIVSGDYVRRGKVKKRFLFYVLFLSQILSPIAFIPVILSYFSQSLHCTAVIILSCVSGTTSLALLITVILGVKVYKCLNNAWFVLVILGLFQAASTTLVVFDVISTKGIRRLTGSCIRSDDLRYTRYFVITQFLESLFICCCFVYVCWKSRGSPDARGRISIELSMDELPIEVPEDPPEKVQTTRRGWWDYVSEVDNRPEPDDRETTIKKPPKRVLKTFLSTIGDFRERQREIKRKRLRAYKKTAQRNVENPSNLPREGEMNDSRNSFAPSYMSRLSRLIPRMELFQEVIKDELLYTTFFTSTCVIVAVLAIIGVNFKNGLSVTGWIALNCKHERDVLLQQPTRCAIITQAANKIAARERRTQARTLSSTLPLTRSLRIASTSDPFADTHALEKPTNPFISALDDKVSGEQPSPEDHDFSSTISILRPNQRDENMTTSQFAARHLSQLPQDLDVPTSTLGTPLVPVSEADISQQQRFYQDWIISGSRPSSYSASERSIQVRETLYGDRTQ
uniref:Uncharacterized protein n=1 Tax=Psilocybe cubensis TaxID=181762 RepID=A0A8H8CQM9_PSICU